MSLRKSKSYEETYGDLSTTLNTTEDDSFTEPKSNANVPDSEGVIYGELGGKYGDHKKLSSSAERKFGIPGNGDAKMEKDPYQSLDKRDKAVVHDYLLGDTSRSHMPYSE
eukprot:TRINITY_DN662_c0_g1_i1.p1 TRINITY_DN662_c0_g1~~TRINITY_DN662_c0_g1_i1.p1  ORF type:complete len:110 (-),score=19.02 TRINITY_DN662_c0_g1_i1:61-390(-)